MTTFTVRHVFPKHEAARLGWPDCYELWQMSDRPGRWESIRAKHGEGHHGDFLTADAAIAKAVKLAGQATDLVACPF